MLHTISNPTPAADDGFGVAVAMAGDRLIVGSPRDDAAGIDAGAVHVFDVSSGALQATFVNPTPDGADDYGSAVGLSLTAAVVGAQVDDAAAQNAGAAYAIDLGIYVPPNYRLVADLESANPGSNPAGFIQTGNFAFFTADTPDTGRELWRTDGTVLGTKLVRDVAPGPTSSALTNFANVGGTLFFTAVDASGTELWKSDGTFDGTVRVKDIRPGAASSNPKELLNVNGTLFFVADDGTRGVELWKSDGTDAGTVIYRDIYTGANSADPKYLTNVSGVLYFSAVNGQYGGFADLWYGHADPNNSGPKLLADFSRVRNPYALTNVNGKLFFYSDSDAQKSGLYKLDSATSLPMRISSSAYLTATDAVVGVGSVFYFTSDGGDLWKSDGTDAGTLVIKSSSFPQRITRLTNVSGVLYFTVSNSQTNRSAVFRSLGTAGSTVLVAEFDGSNSVTDLTNVGGKLYFAASVTASGRELWRIDGPAAAAAFVKDIRPGSLGGFPSQLANFNGSLLFAANDGLHGVEPWRLFGTDSQTLLLKDIRGRDESPSATFAGEFLVVGPSLFFWTTTAAGLDRLWKLVGDEEPLLLVEATSVAKSLEEVNGYVYFENRSASGSLELWRTDPLTDVTTRVALGSASELTNVNGTLYFNGDGGSSDQELWKSDGTDAGTVRVRNISSQASSHPAELLNVAGTLYFTANDGSYGYQLWRSNGTVASTVLVKEILPHPDVVTIGSALDGALFFYTSNVASADGLWKTDGTEAGTTLIALSETFSKTSVVVGDKYYFVRSDEESGLELWKTDGTMTGTQLVADINPTGDSTPYDLANVNGSLYFTANDGTSGYELWKSDGSAEGTVRVIDLNPGAASGTNEIDVTPLLFNNGFVYFVATNGIRGRELWRTDGSSAGTTLAADIRAGAGDSDPLNLSLVDGKLYFTANDGVHGRELWVIDLTAAGDYNLDGTVDGADLLFWQQALGSPAVPAGSGADGDGSGLVDADDLAVWAQAFSTLPSTATTSLAVTTASLSTAAIRNLPEMAIDAAFASNDGDSSFAGQRPPGFRTRLRSRLE